MTLAATPRDRDVVAGGRGLRIGLVSAHTSPLQQPGTGDGGGLNVYVAEVARRLAERGHRVDVLTRRTDPDQPEVVELAGRDLRVVHLPAGPATPLDKQDLPSHLCSFSMQALRRQAPYDLLHSHYWLSGWVARRLARRWDVPFAHTFHTLGLMKNQALAPGDLPEPPLRLIAEQRIADDADRVLALTCGEGRLLHARLGMSGARITVVPPGVDVDRFHPDEADGHAGLGDRARAALDAVGDAPLVLFVGRLQPLKGPDVAVRTLAAVREHVPDAHLLVVGGASGSDGNRIEPGDLRALAERHDIGDAVHVVPARPQDELAVLYRRADVVHVPSRTETFGLVALEAQASGTPVVASAVDGLHAVVDVGGTLVDGHDPADHAAAIVHWLTDPAAAAAAATEGRAQAVAHSWEATVDRLEAVYRDMVVPSAVSAAA